MRAIKANVRRRSPWMTLVLGMGVLVGGGVLTVALLGAMKVIDLEKLAFWRRVPAETKFPADWVAIPVSVKPIPAYTAVTRDYLLKPGTGEWMMDHQPPERVPKNVITDVNKIRGRVTARDKGATFYFSEADFLPPGTRPGVVGGTPSGKRAITLDAAKLKGVHDLHEGDHLDLLASIPVDMPGSGHGGAGRSGQNVVASPEASLLPKRSIVRPLVQDGVVVTPVRNRIPPTANGKSTNSNQTPLQEIVVAVDPQEVAPLAEAMDLKYEITCVARSGRPATVADTTVMASPNKSNPSVLNALANIALGSKAGPSSDKPTRDANTSSAAGQGQVDRGVPAQTAEKRDITPGFNPMENTRFVEMMVGGQRQYVAFTGPGGSPVIAVQPDPVTKPEVETPAKAADDPSKL